MTKATLRLDEGLKATMDVRGLSVIIDEPVEEGGSNLGPKPTELLLAALGGCAAITVKLYAQRKGWPLKGVEIDLSMERFAAAEYPAYTGPSDWVNEFRQRITFKGELDAAQKQRLLEIAGKCPVHKMLQQPNFMIEELVDQLIAEETL